MRPPRQRRPDAPHGLPNNTHNHVVFNPAGIYADLGMATKWIQDTITYFEVSGWLAGGRQAGRKGRSEHGRGAVAAHASRALHCTALLLRLSLQATFFEYFMDILITGNLQQLSTVRQWDVVHTAGSACDCV